MTRIWVRCWTPEVMAWLRFQTRDKFPVWVQYFAQDGDLMLCTFTTEMYGTVGREVLVLGEWVTPLDVVVRDMGRMKKLPSVLTVGELMGAVATGEWHG